MTFTQADLPHIKWSLLTFLLVLTIGGGTVLIAQKYATDSQNALNAAQQQANDARKMLSGAQDDLQNMSDYQKEFSVIQQRGIAGEEQRLNLIEDLDSLRNLNHVLAFKYGIDPQKAFAPLTPMDSGNFDIKFSPMKLQLELLHEGQFIHFMDSLRKDMNGWFILNKCTLERSSATGQLKADCEGGWLTMKNRNAQ